MDSGCLESRLAGNMVSRLWQMASVLYACSSLLYVSECYTVFYSVLLKGSVTEGGGLFCHFMMAATVWIR